MSLNDRLQTIPITPEGEGVIVIDWGSNNLRAEYITCDDTSAPVLSETIRKTTARLQEDISDKGHIGKKKRKLLEEFFEEVFKWACKHRVREAVIIGTSAIREDARREETLGDMAKVIKKALDGKIKKKKIIERINIVSGETEAQLAALAVVWSTIDPLGTDAITYDRATTRFHNGSIDGIVCDIGGGSLEMTLVRQGNIIASFTTPFGAIRLQQRFGDNLEAAFEAVTETLEGLRTTLAAESGMSSPRTLYLTGGGFRNLMRVYGSYAGDPYRHAHNLIIPAPGDPPFQEFLTLLPEMASPQLDALNCREDRQAQIGQVTTVVKALAEVFEPQQFISCSHSIRKGVLHALHLQEDGRDVNTATFTDPLLLQSQRYADNIPFTTDAQAIYDRLPEGFMENSHHGYRLKMAFCLLADLDLDQLPELRGASAFARVMEVGKKKHDLLSPLDPKSRLLLGLALVFRHQDHLPALAEDFLSDLTAARHRMGVSDIEDTIAEIRKKAKKLGKRAWKEPEKRKKKGYQSP